MIDEGCNCSKSLHLLSCLGKLPLLIASTFKKSLLPTVVKNHMKSTNNLELFDKSLRKAGHSENLIFIYCHALCSRRLERKVCKVMLDRLVCVQKSQRAFPRQQGNSCVCMRNLYKPLISLQMSRAFLSKKDPYRKMQLLF